MPLVVNQCTGAPILVPWDRTGTLCRDSQIMVVRTDDITAHGRRRNSDERSWLVVLLHLHVSGSLLLLIATQLPNPAVVLIGIRHSVTVTGGGVIVGIRDSFGEGGGIEWEVWVFDYEVVIEVPLSSSGS